MSRQLDLSGVEPAQARYITLLVEAGQKAMALTTLFGKDYLWMKDPETNHWYLERLPDA